MELERTTLSRVSTADVPQKPARSGTAPAVRPRQHTTDSGPVRDKRPPPPDIGDDDDDASEDDSEIPFEHSYLTGDSDIDTTTDTFDRSDHSVGSQASYTEAHNVVKVPLKAAAASPETSMVSSLDSNESSTDAVGGGDNSLHPDSGSSDRAGFFAKMTGALRGMWPWQGSSAATTSSSVGAIPQRGKPTHPLLRDLPLLPSVEPWTKTHYIVFDRLYQLFRASPDLFDPDLPENAASLANHPLLSTLDGARLSRFGYVVTLRQKHLVLCSVFLQLLVLADRAEYEALYRQPIVVGNIRPGPEGVPISDRDIVVRLMSMIIVQRKRRDLDRGLDRDVDTGFAAFSPAGEDEWYDLTRLAFWMNNRVSEKL